MATFILLISLLLFGNGAGQRKDNSASSKQPIHQYERELEDSRMAGDLNSEIKILNKIALAHADSRNFDEALKYYDKALAIGRLINNKEALAETYKNIAYVYGNRGDIDNCRKYGDEARKSLDAKNSPLESARVHISLGIMSMRYDLYQDALDFYNTALTLYRSKNDKEGTVKALNGLGWAYYKIGDYHKALDYTKEALDKANILNNDDQKILALTVIVDSHLKLEDPDTALSFAEIELQLSKKTQVNSRISYVYMQYGDIYSARREYEKALQYYDDALKMAVDHGSNYLNAILSIKVGSIHVLNGNRELALSSLSKTLMLSRVSNNHELGIRALHLMAVIHRDAGSLDESQQEIAEAVNLIESSRLKINGRQDRETFFATVRKSYELYIDILMQRHKQTPDKGFAEVALQVSERSRARNLREMLAESRLASEASIPTDLFSEERFLNQKLNSIARVIETAIGREKTDAEKELRELSTNYESVQRKIRIASPKYASITQPQPLSVSEMQNMLDDDTAILEYVNNCPRSYLFVITRNKIYSHEIVGRCHLDDSAIKVYKSLTARQLQTTIEQESFEQRIERIKKADAEFWKEAEDLSQKIFMPAVENIKQSKLIIVADGVLQYIPFTALPFVEKVEAGSREIKNKTTLLIDKYEISYLPSISSLVEIRKDIINKPSSERTIAVMANPVFSRNDPRFNPLMGNQMKEEAKTEQSELLLRAWGSISKEGTIPSLPSTEKEGRDIFKLAPNRSGLLAMGFEAKRSLIESGELSKYRYLHFATHSIFNSQYPELSGLILSLYKPNGDSEDGYLRLNDIYNMNLSADLVVLSACQTGIGKNVNGEGLIGLTRGFMYAGASRVVAGLWKVDDAATSRLMTKFYDGMFNKKLRPSAALRDAQRSIMRREDGQLLPPFFWAAFIQQGEYR